MVLKVFSVYDEKAEAYLAPFFMPTEGMALRAFKDSVGDEKSQFCKHPEDFTLWVLAEFDDVAGVFNSKEISRRLINARELRNVVPVGVKAVS